MTDQTKAAAIFDALDAFMNRRPRLDPRNYFDTWRDHDGRRAYNRERLQISRDLQRAKQALEAARALEPVRLPELLAAFRAFSGRLSWDADKGELHYTAGQYFPTEYRKAAAAVLESYIAAWRRTEAAHNPQRFVYADIADVIAANRQIGNHWFDRDTMRFFKTKIVSRLIAGKRFVTSERGPHDARARFTIREARPDGTIDTVGKFQAYGTRAAAMRDVLMEDPKRRTEVVA